jgi:hypothetical protein
MSMTVSPGANFADRLFGKLYADKGYIAQWLTAFLKDLGIDFVTKVKKNMKPSPCLPLTRRCYGSDPSWKPSSTN